VANTGLAFSDAERVLRFRRNGILQDDAERFFGYEVGILASSQGARLGSDRVDTYADGPVLNSINEVLQPSVQTNADDDETGQPWSGSDERRRFTDINQLFDPVLGLGARITGQDLLAVPLAQRRAGHTNSTYNAYTYYRAIGQLGTDSPDARFESGFHSAYGRVNGGRAALPTYYRRAKLNLNYAHDPDGDGIANASVAALERWTPLNWFINAADRLLLSEFTNGLPIVRSPEIRRLIANDPTGYTPYGFPVFGSVVARDGSLTNYVYDSQVHRLLQFAANIYDYANASAEYDLKVTAGPGTNNYRLQAPHVYRPRFYVDQRDLDRDALNPVLRIGGYELVENTTAVADRWLTPQEAVATVPRGLPGKIEPSTQINVLGMPWIIGAKKGLPNFNEGFWQSAMQVTRRMRLVKPVAATTLPANQSPFSSGAAGRGVRAQVQYRVTLTNSVGVEAWNSYNFDFPVAVQVQVRQTNHYAVYAEFQNGLRKVWPATAAPIVANNLLTTHTLPAGKWRASEFVGVATNYLADFIYDPGTLRAFPAAATNFGWVDVATPPPALTLAVTNQMVFSILSAGNPQRVLDVVSMQSVVYETNILRYLGAPAGIGGIQIASSRSSDSRPGGEMSQFWLTNSAGLAGTAGISNQLSASLGRYDNIGNLWRDARGAGVRLEDRQFAIDGLNYFLYQTNRAGLTAAQIETIRRQFGGTNVQAGFNPSPLVVFTDRRQANDPLVHQLKDDLLPGYTAVAIAAPGFPGAYAAEVERNGARLIQGGSVWPLNWRPVQPGQPLTRWFNAVTGPVGFRISSDWPANLTTNYWTAQIRPYRNSDPIALRKFQQAGSPWGKVPQLGATATGGADFSRQNLGIKDPQIASSDNWRFLAQTTNAPTDLEHLSYPNLGWLGRVHRGTPWQTAYLKSAVVDLRQQNGLEGAPWIALFFGEINDWASWAGNANTHPVNDWKLMDLFTTAVNDNAAHGLLAVNQTNLAAWAAVLSGVPVLDNRANSADPQSLILRPDSSEVAQILSGYTNQQAQVVTPGLLTMLTVTNSLAQGFPVTARAPGGTFTNLGSILSVPTLSDQAPFVIADPSAINVTDEVVERLPQQILSLLRADEPTVTVYAYGQSLKPAPNSFYLKPGNFYGMVTNYVVTGEFATKTLLRFEGTPNAPTTKVEDHRILFQNP
jgi:hypothetical protein